MSNNISLDLINVTDVNKLYDYCSVYLTENINDCNVLGKKLSDKTIYSVSQLFYGQINCLLLYSYC